MTLFIDKFIFLGPLPIGFKFEAKQHSDETHLMEIPFDDDTENKADVYYNLKAFLEVNV